MVQAEGTSPPYNFRQITEETIMGDFLEELAIFVVRKTVKGDKSGIEGVDFEYSTKGTRYLFSMKSGLNWGNSSQWSFLQRDSRTNRA